MRRPRRARQRKLLRRSQQRTQLIVNIAYLISCNLAALLKSSNFFGQHINVCCKSLCRRPLVLIPCQLSRIVTNHGICHPGRYGHAWHGQQQTNHTSGAHFSAHTCTLSG